LQSADKVLVCTHATFRFAVEELGIDAFDDRLIAIDEFHHVSSNPDSILGTQLTELITRDKTHVVAMTGSYFRGDGDAVLSPSDEAKFEKWARLAIQCAKDLASYQSPTFRAIAVTGPDPDRQAVVRFVVENAPIMIDAVAESTEAA
jgi:hypothetical protein